MPGSASGLGNSITQPGFTPNYAGLISGDPSYQLAQQNASASGIANASQRAAATQQALIQFGLVPSFSGLGLSPDQQNFLSQDITPDISALANQNTANGFSTEGQLQRQNSQNVLQLQQQLAGRGALSSGEANYQLNNNEQNYNQAQSNAVNQLLSTITGYQNQYVTAQQTAAQQLQAAMQAAEQAQMNLPQNQPTQQQSFNYDSASGKYTGAGGTYTPHTTANGNVVVDDSTGTAYILNPDGTIGDVTSYAPQTPIDGGWEYNSPGPSSPGYVTNYGTPTPPEYGVTTGPNAGKRASGGSIH